MNVQNNNYNADSRTQSPFVGGQKQIYILKSWALLFYTGWPPKNRTRVLYSCPFLC